MITLALETSTQRGSVALLENGATVFSEHFAAGRGHGSVLFLSLERARKLFHHLDQVAVGLGPGSYSGTRIAIAAAIGVQLSTNAKLAGIASVAAMDTEEKSYLAIGDARRETYYYAQVTNGLCIEGPRLLHKTELEEKIRDNAGMPVFSSAAVDFVASLQINFPTAENIARLAQLGTGIYPAENLEPIYLRDAHITQPKKV